MVMKKYLMGGAAKGVDPCWFGSVSADDLYKMQEMHRG